MKGQGFFCKDCVCFYADLSKLSPDFPARAGCAEGFVSMRLPHDKKAHTPTHVHSCAVHFTEADTSAAGCADFTREGGEK